LSTSAFALLRRRTAARAIHATDLCRHLPTRGSNDTAQHIGGGATGLKLCLQADLSLQKRVVPNAQVL
jgi:hypothetical protein